MRVSSLMVCTFLFVMAGLWMAAERGATQATITENKTLSEDLQKRAKQYLDFRKNVAGNAPRPTDTPANLTKAQKKLADKIRIARAGVNQGEIFTPEIAEFLRHQIASTLTGPDGDKIRASLQHAEPVQITLQVNVSYPEKVPLQSTPASLLSKLPELPKGLEYRFVGRELVLRDVDANIVVDYVPNALPS